MFKIQFLNAWRNLVKNKVVSLINITGLTIGFTCAIFAIYYSYHELNYESCHKNADRISCVYTLGKFGSMEKIPVTFGPVGAYLQSNYPEIELMARSREVNGIAFQNNITPISENDIVLSDSSIFSILSIPFKNGGMPSGPEEIVLSEKMAMKYFNDNAVGKNIIISICEKKRNFLVTGIFNPT
jgi:putative ABC transport system permease protein